MKTRVLPTVGKQYISRKDDVVVEVTDITRADDESVCIWFKAVNRDLSYGYYLDCFWANYMVMEGEDD